MKTRPSSTVLVLAVAALGAAAYAVASFAQTAATPAPAPSATSPAPAASGTPPAPAGEVGQRPGEGSKQDDNEALPPPPTASGKPTPQRFEPTEKVRPDFDVAFPVDI